MINQLIPVILSFLIVIFSGYFAVSLIDRDLELRFRFLFSIPMGFGIHSILYFLYQYLNIYDFHKYQLFEYSFVIILAILYFNQERPDLSKHKFKRLNKWFYVLNVYALSIFFQYYLINPMGQWDGFRIWNTKAQFLLVQSPLWHNLFKLPDFMSHCDYPLFLPSSTARLWLYNNTESYFLNVLAGALFTFTIVYLLYQAISYFKNEKTAIIVSSLLMISDIFLYNGASQCADIPLALFFLSAVACLFIFFKTNRNCTLILGLIFAGLSVWVKNEGLMFLAVYSTVLTTYFLSQKNFKQFLSVIVTTIPFVVFAIWFKNLSAVSNDLFLCLSQKETLVFLVDKQRYLFILKTFLKVLFNEFSLFLALAILALKGFKIKDKIKTPFFISAVVLILMILGYVIVYAVSPHDIKWLVENSLIRIILQILPVFLLIFSLSLRIGKPDTLN